MRTTWMILTRIGLPRACGLIICGGGAEESAFPIKQTRLCVLPLKLGNHYLSAGNSIYVTVLSTLYVLCPIPRIVNKSSSL